MESTWPYLQSTIFKNDGRLSIPVGTWFSICFARKINPEYDSNGNRRMPEVPYSNVTFLRAFRISGALSKILTFSRSGVNRTKVFLLQISEIRARSRGRAFSGYRIHRLIKDQSLLRFRDFLVGSGTDSPLGKSVSILLMAFLILTGSGGLNFLFPVTQATHTIFFELRSKTSMRRVP